MMENANWNTMLLAADETLNNSLLPELSGLFPEYTIVQAFDWFDIGRKMTEEKPGIILLDAEVPGAELSRFISIVKEDSAFGKPFVFLISSGQRAETDAYEHADAVFSKPLDFPKLKAMLNDIEKQLDAVTA
jgi:CheY-like chemotaxis protein